MLYDIFPIIIIIVSLAIIVFILLKKIPRVAAVDIKKIPEETQGQIKRDLIEKKIDRKLSFLGRKLKPLSEKAGESFTEQFNKFKKKISDLEHKYKERDKGLAKDFSVSAHEIKNLIEEADCFVREESLEKAEKKYLEVISADSRNIMAYAGLGNIYYKKRELIGAQEAMEYVVKLAENGYGELEAADFALLALIYKDLEDFGKALRSIRKAVKLEPNNPKNLDLLCKISIISRNREEAVKACDKLAQVNPSNEKIKEFREEIKKLNEETRN